MRRLAAVLDEENNGAPIKNIGARSGSDIYTADVPRRVYLLVASAPGRSRSRGWKAARTDYRPEPACIAAAGAT